MSVAIAKPTSPTRWVALMPAVFVVLWSTGFIGAKLGLPYAEPLTFLALRMGLVTALLLAVALALRARWPASPVEAGHIAVAGLLVHGGYLGGVFSAIHHGLSAGLVALIVGLQPVLTAFAAMPVLGERVTRRQWLGLVLGLVGVALVVSSRLSLKGADWQGMALAALALVSITAGTLYQKRYCGAMDLRSGGVIQYAASGLLFWGLAARLETMRIHWTGEFVFALGWLTIVLSLGAISLFYLMIRKGEAAKVSSLFYLTPPVTALMAYALFGERLTALALAGMGVAAAGVALVTRRTR